MPKYTVVVREVVRYKYEIEAENAAEAEELGLEAHVQTENLDTSFMEVSERTAGVNWA